METQVGDWVVEIGEGLGEWTPGTRETGDRLRPMDWGDLWIETQAQVWGTWRGGENETTP